MKIFSDINTMYDENYIPHDIRTLFPVIKEEPTNKELIEKIQINQYLEKTEDIYRLNLVNKKGILDDITLVTQLDDPPLKAIAWACLSGIHTFNGNYKEAITAINKALDQPVKGDVKAYVFTELSNLLRKLGYLGEAITVLEYTLIIARDDNLIWRTKTYQGLSCKYENPDMSLNILSSSADYYKSKKDTVRLGNVFRHIGSIYTYLNDFKKAQKYINQAMELAIQNSLLQYQYEAMNDLGWLYIQKNEYDKARQIFLGLLKKDLSPYLMSLALQNLGYIEYRCFNYKKAVSYHSYSLQLTVQYEMRDMAFEDYYKLGICYEKLGEMALANHFYAQGFEEVQKEMQLGLRLLGYRKKLVDTYVRFLQKNQKHPLVDLKEEIFGFTVNKPLKEIREIFHKSLLNLHLEQTKNAPELCAKLGIDKRTYFLYQKKLGLKRGDSSTSIINSQFKEYLESLTTHSWKEANQRFEKDLFSFLLSKYQYNKKKLAEVLNVSYGLVIQKTK